jgi:hypothetical protein
MLMMVFFFVCLLFPSVLNEITLKGFDVFDHPHRGQNGYWRWPLWELIQITSLKSSRLRGPVRPQPLSRTPPIGA